MLQCAEFYYYFFNSMGSLGKKWDMVLIVVQACNINVSQALHNPA